MPGVIGPAVHDHHIWDVGKVRALVADRDEPVTFFCGGSRNSTRFLELFDDVFILEIDPGTLTRRLDERAEDEWGGVQAERDLVLRLHRTREGLPGTGESIDATAPVGRVVDEILRRSGAAPGLPASAEDL